MIIHEQAQNRFRPENLRMMQFLQSHGIDAIPKYIRDGSLRGTWRIYQRDGKWSQELADKFNELGFQDFDYSPLGEFSGNGGMFQVFVRGHDELLNDTGPTPAAESVRRLVDGFFGQQEALELAKDKPETEEEKRRKAWSYRDKRMGIAPDKKSAEVSTFAPTGRGPISTKQNLRPTFLH